MTHYALITAVLTVWASAARAADPAATNAPATGLLLIDSLGHTVHLDTNQVARPMQPLATTLLPHQFSGALEGVKAPVEALTRLVEARVSQLGLQLFPAVPPRLPSYLSGVDDYGNTAIRPGALITYDPFDVLPQYANYWASE
jgi:hypothetical protein